MKGRRLLAMVLGGVMALGVAGAAVPVAAAAAETAMQQERGVQHYDEFNRAIRAEHDRHERKLQEIREEYASHHHELQQEMKEERERHAQKMREIHRNYYDETARHDSYSRSSHE